MTHNRSRAIWLASCLALPMHPGAGHAATLTTLHSFTGLSDGATPVGQLLYVNGALYGTAQFGGTTGTTNCPDGCGVVFKTNPKTGKQTVVYSFQGGTDGAFPEAGLIYSNGLFYGTTGLGGGQKCFESTEGCGTVFQLDPATGTETTLYPFGNGGVDGELVMAGVTLVNGVLYGTTALGGTSQVGNVYSYNLSSGIGSNLYNFTGSPDEFPEAGLLSFDDTLYGTTTGQGQDFGTVFAYAPQSGVETLLHQFSGQDGASPQAGLVAYKGMLYGTTSAGGETQRDGGTVFKIDPLTGAESVVYSFTGGSDGAGPTAGLIVVGKMLYGTTLRGGGYFNCPDGSEGCGTIFQVDPATGKEKVLYRFTGESDEGNPQAGLAYKNGAFYGTTAVNGQNSCYNNLGCGTVFRFVP